MKRYTLIIADSSEDLRVSLQAQFNHCCNIRCCETGFQVLELLRRAPADVLVLDLMLPELDGLSLLSALSAAGDCPGILALSAYVSPYVAEKAQKLGVSYLMEKPCDLLKVQDCIRLLLQNRNAPPRQDRFMRISGLLLRLGFSAKLRGYAYLRDAVLKYLENPGLSIIKELYPQVGAVYGVSGEDVEHSIRSAAMDAWSHGGGEPWMYYFPESEGLRPSNAALIQQLSEQISPFPCLEALEIV